METAALLGLPNARWYSEVRSHVCSYKSCSGTGGCDSSDWLRQVQLRERDWGAWDLLSVGEREGKHADELSRRDRDSMFFAPPGGESLAHVVGRIDNVLGELNTLCPNKSANLAAFPIAPINLWHFASR
jgi:hypothetical protein